MIFNAPAAIDRLVTKRQMASADIVNAAPPPSAALKRRRVSAVFCELHGTPSSTKKTAEAVAL